MRLNFVIPLLDGVCDLKTVKRKMVAPSGGVVQESKSLKSAYFGQSVHGFSQKPLNLF